MRISVIAVVVAALVTGVLATAADRAVAAGVTVTSISPAQGPATANTVVTIKGTGFPVAGDCDAPYIDVQFGGMSAFPLEQPTATQVRVYAPSLPAGPVTVTVHNPCTGITATVVDGYRYLATGIIGGSIPKTGFGLFVFSGGTDKDLVKASTCDAATATFWATDKNGDFVTFIPGATIVIVNAEWHALFPDGIPYNTALIGRCA